MKGSLWVVVIVGVGLVVGLIAIPAQLSAISHVEHANNEGGSATKIQSNTTHHLDPGNGTEIIELYDNETVIDNETGVQYIEGTDYYLNGTQLRAVNGSAADGEYVNISYTYRTADERTNQIASLYGVIGPIIPYVFIAAVLGLLIAYGGWW